MAGERAERYISEVWLPALHNASRAEKLTHDDIRDAFSNPYKCIHAFYDNYAFARRGKDRDDLSQMAVQALRRTVSEDTIQDLLEQEDGTAVWESFCRICEERKRKNSEQLNRGLIAGIVELAQEVYRMNPADSIADWVVEGIAQTDRIEQQFLRIVDIRGVGPKTTSTFLRDVVYLYDLEDALDNADRLYIQPIDRWIRLISRHVIPDIDHDRAVDWVIAGKLAKYTRKAGVSGIRFNLGCSFFGAREVREPGRFEEVLQRTFA